MTSDVRHFRTPDVFGDRRSRLRCRACSSNYCARHVRIAASQPASKAPIRCQATIFGFSFTIKELFVPGSG
jgi:hypothetical protein